MLTGGIMETINLDAIENTSLYVIDESPCLQDKTSQLSKRKKRSIRKNFKKKVKIAQPQNTTNHYFLLGGGGTLASENSVKKKRVENNNVNIVKNRLETIVIDDDGEDSSDLEDVIVLSDDEVTAVGIIGGELSSATRPAPMRLDNFRRRINKQVHNGNKKPAISIDTNDYVNSQGRNSERKLRPIVIDGSNVAFGHGKTIFSSRGIEICCEYFLKRGHTVKVFLPQFRRRHMATKDTHILDKLENDGIIVFTPSRVVNGKPIVSYDDRMMVEYAAQSGAILVTRDNLRDLALESKEFEKVVREQVLMFTWVDSEVILFPQDPLGRDGPKLDEFLSFPMEHQTGNEMKNETGKKKKRTKK